MPRSRRCVRKAFPGTSFTSGSHCVVSVGHSSARLRHEVNTWKYDQCNAIGSPVHDVVQEDGILLPYLVLLIDELVLDLFLIFRILHICERVLAVLDGVNQ